MHGPITSNPKTPLPPLIYYSLAYYGKPQFYFSTVLQVYRTISLYSIISYFYPLLYKIEK